MRKIGNTYVKQEFKLHKNVKNDQQLFQFRLQWTEYAKQLQKRRITNGKFENSNSQNLFNEEQKGKLMELKAELKKL